MLNPKYHSKFESAYKPMYYLIEMDYSYLTYFQLIGNTYKRSPVTTVHAAGHRDRLTFLLLNHP